MLDATTDTAHATDAREELAAFGHATDSGTAAARAVTDLVERNPLPAVLVAAAAGAGLMALLSLMARRDPEPLVPVTLPTTRGFDYEALKRQITDLTDRLTDKMANTAPIDTAKQRVSEAGDVIANGWSTVREQALEALDRFEPQASAAIKIARENPMWTALVVGALGALVGSQMLGGKAEASETGSDVRNDA